MTDSKEIRAAAQKNLKAARKALAAARAAEKAEIADADGGMSASLLASILHGAPCVDAVADAEKALAAAELEAERVERVIAGRGKRARARFMEAMGDRYGF